MDILQLLAEVKVSKQRALPLWTQEVHEKVWRTTPGRCRTRVVALYAQLAVRACRVPQGEERRDDHGTRDPERNTSRRG